MNFTQLIDLLTLAITTILVYKSISKCRYDYRYTVHILFSILYVFPLFLDLIWGIPQYESFLVRGFQISSSDNYTRIIYDFSILLVQFMLLLSFRKRRKTHINIDTFSEKTKNWIWLGIVVAPVFQIIFGRSFSILYLFQWRELSFGSVVVPPFYYITESLSYIGVCCSLLLLFNKKLSPTAVSKVMASIFLYFNICIEGKRAILFFCILNIVVLFVFKIIDLNNQGKNTRNKWFLFVVLSVLFLFYIISSSISVKINRGFDKNDNARMIESTRIDFFRDDRVRMAIYSEINPDKMKILKYKGQSIIYDMIYIFPLQFFFDGSKYGSYQQHLSNALVENNMDDDKNFMTVTVYAELISNFGIIFGTLLMGVLCIISGKALDRFNYPLNVLAMNTFILINLFTMSYIMLFIEYMVVFYILNKSKIKKKYL